MDLINNEIYHVVTRGINDETIFKDDADHYRGVFSVYEFNNAKPVEIRNRRRQRKVEKSSGGLILDSRELLVDVLVFVFMPNHIHLLLKQLRGNGITKFMQKMGTGYASYANIKYRRKGHLFQARFKAIHIDDEEQLKNAFVYIHSNPVSLVEPNWKNKGISNPEKTIKFLENYRWSSYIDYIGKKNFPSVTNRELIEKILGGEQGCRKFVENWIKYKGELKSLRQIVLE